MLLVLFTLLAVAFLVWAATSRSGSSPSRSLDDLGLVGATGEAQETFSSEGRVLVRGELWKATTPHGIIQRRSKVRVTGYKGALTLIVEPDSGVASDKEGQK
jgi:membrane protein implicated in regulation of membrane protease activity